MIKLFHPLAGCKLNTYRRLLCENRPYDRKQKPRLWIAGIVAMLRSPATWIEDQYCRFKFAGMATPDNPIFIVGHWRSGTTYLYSMLSRDPQFGYVSLLQRSLPWNFLNRHSPWVYFMKAFLPKQRKIDNMPMGVDVPGEEEMAWANMGLISFYHAYYFPQSLRETFRRSILFEGVSEEEIEQFARGHEYFFKKLVLHNGGKRLLLKNPPSTAARISWLKELFPKAQFIHIYRNPFHVFPSMVQALEKSFALTALQAHDNIDIESIVLEMYRLMYERFFEEAEKLPELDLYQLPFERFEADPLGEVAKMYQYFDWPGWDAAEPALSQYCQSTGDYRKNSHMLTRKQVTLIEQQWGFALEHWGYGLPDSLVVEE